MKTIYLTGGNSGIGFATASALLDDGHRVIIGCRTPEKAEKARLDLISQTGSKEIEVSLLDLASFASIRTAVESLSEPISGLICNAGLTHSTATHFTEDGFEETFGVNHLGHFLLTKLLLEKYGGFLERIAVVSSALHNPETSGGGFPPPKINSFEALAHPPQSSTLDAKALGSQRYVNSKLCNLFFTYELNRRLQSTENKEIKVNAFNPGFIPDTGLARDTQGITRFMMKYLLPGMRTFFKWIRSTSQAANELKKLATEVEVTGKYFDGAQAVKSSDLSYDQKLAADLWEASIRWTDTAPPT